MGLGHAFCQSRASGGALEFNNHLFRVKHLGTMRLLELGEDTSSTCLKGGGKVERFKQEFKRTHSGKTHTVTS